MAVTMTELHREHPNLDPREYAECERLIALHGDTYDAPVDVIADAREMLR